MSFGSKKLTLVALFALLSFPVFADPPAAAKHDAGTAGAGVGAGVSPEVKHRPAPEPKPGWTEEYKKAFMDNCVAEAIKAFPYNAEPVRAYCTCALNRVITIWTPDTVPTDPEDKNLVPIETACAESSGLLATETDKKTAKPVEKKETKAEATEKPKSGWTEKSQQAFLDNCIRETSVGFGNEKSVKTYCTCVLNQVSVSWSPDKMPSDGNDPSLKLIQDRCVRESGLTPNDSYYNY